MGAEAVAKEGERDVAEACEDNYDGEPGHALNNESESQRVNDLPDFPGIDVVLVDISVVPTHHEIVCRGHDPCRANCIVRANVRYDGDFAGKADVGEQELAEKWRKGPSNEPEPDGVEEQLVAAICVLFPSSKFVIDSERNTLLEAISSPSCEANNVSIHLQTQGHVKVLGNVRFRPKLLVAIFVKVRDLLDCRPAKDSIVTNERRNIAIGNSVADCSVNKVGEEGDAIRVSWW